MVKKVNTKSNELTNKTRKKNNIPPKKDVNKERKTKVNGGSEKSRDFAKDFNNLVNLYYLLEMVSKIKKYNNIFISIDINSYENLPVKEKIKVISQKLVDHIILNNTDYRFRFARKTQPNDEDLQIFANSIEKNLTIIEFGRIKDVGSTTNVFFELATRRIYKNIIKHINKGNAYLFNFRKSRNIFRKNLKRDNVTDIYRLSEDFTTDLFLGDIHFYLRNTVTQDIDFVRNPKVPMVSIDFNEITDDKIKIHLFYKMLKYIFNANNLRKLIFCPYELNFFMYNDNETMQFKNLGLSQKNRILKNCTDSATEEDIRKYMDEKMPILNKINDVKDLEVKILYDKYLKYIKESKKGFCISSFFEFIGYKFTNLPITDGKENKEALNMIFQETLNSTFDNFINIHLKDINVVSSHSKKELSFSESKRNLNDLHNIIFLLDGLEDNDYTELSGYNPLNIRKINEQKLKFVDNYRLYMLDLFKKFSHLCKDEELKKKLTKYILSDKDRKNYQKVLRKSSYITDIKGKNEIDLENYFKTLGTKLEENSGFTKTKTGMFRSNFEAKKELLTLYNIIKDALEKFNKCKKIYKIIIDINPIDSGPHDGASGASGAAIVNPGATVPNDIALGSADGSGDAVSGAASVADFGAANPAGAASVVLQQPGAQGAASSGAVPLKNENYSVYLALKEVGIDEDENAEKYIKFITDQGIFNSIKVIVDYTKSGLNTDKQINDYHNNIDKVLNKLKELHLKNEIDVPTITTSLTLLEHNMNESNYNYMKTKKDHIELLEIVEEWRRQEDNIASISGGKAKNKKKLTQREKDKLKKEKEKAKEKAKKAKEKAKKEKEKAKEKAKKEKEKAKEKAKKEKAKEKAKKAKEKAKKAKEKAKKVTKKK